MDLVRDNSFQNAQQFESNSKIMLRMVSKNNHTPMDAANSCHFNCVIFFAFFGIKYVYGIYPGLEIMVDEFKNSIKKLFPSLY